MTSQIYQRLVLGAIVVMIAMSGCHAAKKARYCDDSCLDYFETVATNIEYPDINVCYQAIDVETLPPRSIDHASSHDFWDLGLEEAITIALENGTVLKDLGGRVLTLPETASTIYDPAIRESDPQFGPEGALSAFDAQLSTSLFWQKNDRVFNNIITGGGVNEFRQDLAIYQSEISKLAATGTRFSIRNLTQYDANNRPSNLFPSVWESQFDVGVRQPLLQGGGVTFNRIAGPNAQPGFNFSTGVLLARVNVDVSLADFEAGVRNFLSDVEDAYWELYFAYRDLDAQAHARDTALETWQVVKAKYDKGLQGGESYKEAQARAQYYLFQDNVQNALAGVPAQGRSAGVFRGERRLRLLLGLPANDGRLIRPKDEPSMAKFVFEWDEVLDESLVRRVELRRQNWQIKRREMELIAARNFTLPRLDAVANYRLRGFGRDLTGDLTTAQIDANNNIQPNLTPAEKSQLQNRFASAFKDLGSWDHQEWEAGLQLTVPFGFRQGWAAVRHAELQLARERAILNQQQKDVTQGLSDAVAESARAHAAIETGFNRLVASRQDRDETQTAYDLDEVSLDLLLETQRRLADAESRYYQALTDYAKSLKDVHFQKGSLLEYDGVFLSEGSWPRKAYRDARALALRWRPKRFDYVITKPGIVSDGIYPQRLMTVETVDAGDAPPRRIPPVQPDHPLPPPEREPDDGNDNDAARDPVTDSADGPIG